MYFNYLTKLGNCSEDTIGCSWSNVVQDQRTIEARASTFLSVYNDRLKLNKQNEYLIVSKLIKLIYLWSCKMWSLIFHRGRPKVRIWSKIWWRPLRCRWKIPRWSISNDCLCQFFSICLPRTFSCSEPAKLRRSCRARSSRLDSARQFLFAASGSNLNACWTFRPYFSHPIVR